MIKSRLLAILVVSLLGHHSAAHADIWVGTFNSDWFFNGNWNLFDGPPGASDTATLPADSDGVFPITRTLINLSASTQIARLDVQSPLNAQYTISGTSGAKLTATTAADFKNSDLQLLNVHTLSSLQLNTPLVRVFDNAILALDNASLVTTNDVQIAKNGRVDVNNGSSVQSLSYRFDDAAGELRVNSGGELRVAGDTTLVRGKTTINSGGQFNALSGVDLEYNGTALLQFLSDHAVDNGVHLKATGGGDITGTSYIDVGNDNVGALTVTGSGSTFTAGSLSDWGAGAAGKATVTVADSAFVTLNTLRAGTSGGQFIGSITGEATLKTLSNFSMGGGAAVRQVALDINSNGVFQVAGSATFNNAADLNLQSGSVQFNSGAAFNAGSRMDWSGGAVNLGANSTLLINGGVFNKTSTTGFIFGGNTTTRIQSGGAFTALSYFDLGDAKLEVDNGTLTVGTAGGTISDWGASSFSVITLSNNAVATYNSGLRTSTSGGTTQATVSSGARLVASTLSTGGAPTSNTTLNVNNGRVESSGSISFLRGTTVNVISGGAIEGQNVSLGSTGGTTSVEVTGKNSLLKPRDTLVVGQSGNATLTVSAGGRAESVTETILGKQGGAHGTLNVTGSGSTLSVGTKLVVGEEGGATLNISNSAYVPVIGSVVINGSSAINISSNGKLQTSPASSITNEGVLVATDGIIESAVSNFWQLQLTSSSLIGHVTLFEGSELFAKNSSISSLDQQAGAKMGFELDSPGGAQHLTTSGATSLGGDLDLSLIDGHLPTLGNNYPLIQAGSISGFFRTIQGVIAPNGTYLAVVPTATTIQARSVKGGDASLDGRVDGADYTIWADNFLINDRAYYTKGDFNGDGRTDGADYTIWADNFAPAAALSAAVVPEPKTAWMAILGALCLVAHGLRSVHMRANA